MGDAGQGRRTRKPAEARREEIQQAAMRLFARQGYMRTTTKEIAQEAGIAEGTIYKHFASKQDILFAFSVPTIVHSLVDLLDRLGDADDLTILRAIIGNRFALWEQWRDVMRAVLSEALFNAELAEAFYQQIGRKGLEMLEEYLTRRIREGAFRPLNVPVISRSFIGLILTHLLLWNATLGGQHTGVSRAAIIDELAVFFLNGIRAESPAPEATA